jgi:hypothetical protein
MTWRGSIETQGSADSRVGIAGARWQVAAGGDRMWPICRVQCGGTGCGSGFGGARRESSVTVNTPAAAPASCMKSLSACGQNSGRLLSVSQKSRNEKCYLREVTVNRDFRRPADHSTMVPLHVPPIANRINEIKPGFRFVGNPDRQFGATLQC